MASYIIDNPPQNLTMLDFYSQSNMYQSLAKSSRFAVRIVPSGVNSKLIRKGGILRDLTYLCEAAEMPGRGFMNVDLRYYGPNFKIPYQSTYEDVNFTFLCRTESLERRFFDDWMEIINPTKTFDFEYRDNYKSQIHVYQFGDGFAEDDFRSTAPEAYYCWTLHDAYPILVNSQPVTWADDNFQRLGISFTYTKWTRLNLDIEAREPGYELVKDAKQVNNPTKPIYDFMR